MIIGFIPKFIVRAFAGRDGSAGYVVRAGRVLSGRVKRLQVGSGAGR